MKEPGQEPCPRGRPPPPPSLLRIPAGPALNYHQHKKGLKNNRSPKPESLHQTRNAPRDLYAQLEAQTGRSYRDNQPGPEAAHDAAESAAAVAWLDSQHEQAQAREAAAGAAERLGNPDMGNGYGWYPGVAADEQAVRGGTRDPAAGEAARTARLAAADQAAADEQREYEGGAASEPEPDDLPTRAEQARQVLDRAVGPWEPGHPDYRQAEREGRLDQYLAAEREPVIRALGQHASPDPGHGGVLPGWSSPADAAYSGYAPDRGPELEL